jgi:hypothetical protein
MAQERADSGPGVTFYTRGRVKKLVRAQESPTGAELVLEHGNFCQR